MSQLGGYLGKILRVNLSTGKFEWEELNSETAYNFLGGRGYAAKILYDELKPKTNPLGEENKLIFMAGPLTGTGFPGSGRISISSKSPLTGTIFDSSMGGSFGVYLKKSGFDGIIVEGKAEKPVYLLVDDEKVFVEDASPLWGETTTQTEKNLKAKHGNVGVASIGPAGENCVYLANIASDGRFAGRGGLGAVMGSKKLKAVVVKGKKETKIVNMRVYETILKKVRFTIENDPITGKDGSLARFGTAAIVHRIRSAGILPKNDFSGESLSFEEADSFSGETIREKFFVGRRGCYLCPTACGRRIRVGEKTVKGPEYESIVMLGPNSGFYNYEGEIVPLAMLCDELGMDTISIGNILGYARSLGQIKSFEEALKLIREIASNNSVYSKGVKNASKVFGREAAEVKGLELPAYDPRGAKGIALAYITSNRGGCHLRAYTIAPEILSDPVYVDPSEEKGKAELVKRMQDSYAVYDSIIICKYHSLALFTTLKFELEDLAKILSAVTGFEFSDEVLAEIGERIYNVERMFNVREGFTSVDDRLPERFGLNLKRLLTAYYRRREWVKGIPKSIPKVKPPTYMGKEEIFVTPVMRLNPPQIQVALDMDADLKTIVRIAKETYEAGVRIVEAGTPALKRHGVDRLIPALRKVAPEAIIVADMKIADVGGLEARIAFRAGADVVAVLGMGGKNKIIEALGEAIRMDKAILIDMIDCEDPIGKLENLRKDLAGKEDWVIFCLHRGISEQMKSRGIYDQKTLIKEFRAKLGKFPMAVAGGIREGTAKEIVSQGVEIVIVGSAIYNSTNPKSTAKRFLEEVKAYYKPFHFS